MSTPLKALPKPSPPAKSPAVRVGRLDTIADVRRELARLYRVARHTAGGKLDAVTASKLAYLLNCIGRSLEGSDLERRIAMLETRLTNKEPP